MRMQCEYFLAADDLTAALVVEDSGGPAGGESDARARRAPTLSLPGVEPAIALAKLEELLTGRSYEEISADPTGAVLATAAGGRRSVVSVTDTVQRALAATDDATLRAVAVPWSEPDDSRGCRGGNARAAAEVLVALAAFVRDGRARGLRLYCCVRVGDAPASPGAAAGRGPVSVG